MQSCAASVLLCAMTSAGRWSFSIVQAIVAVLPVPVAPSSVWKRLPPSIDAAISSIARGWSPIGAYWSVVLKARCISGKRSPSDRGYPSPGSGLESASERSG